ncbi:MAG: hypothetical protein IT374_17020 [Polyangiaceae bacterium]|nr:hypothetical protein [Polyangiaceae bacterium]
MKNVSKWFVGLGFVSISMLVACSSSSSGGSGGPTLAGGAAGSSAGGSSAGGSSAGGSSAGGSSAGGSSAGGSSAGGSSAGGSSAGGSSAGGSSAGGSSAGDCASMASNDCFQCCDDGHNNGLTQALVMACACNAGADCNSQCAATICAGQQPSQDCVTCLNGLSDSAACINNINTECNKLPDCKAAIPCVQGCPQ